ncbi:uncharacterized protein [Montipora foliosa]|uniref:uncharacterized protein n=1 Tax=Montipora foliosa TaxID=591990 RepID=UPI0035F16A36
MISSTISVIFLEVAALSTPAEARSDESLVLRVFNPDHRPSDTKMRAMLKKADLEGHGYSREFTTSLISSENTTNPTYEKRYFNYKTVPCSRAQEVVQQLETLLPEAYGVAVSKKISSEMKARNLTNMKQCKVGLEVHFKDGGGCKSGKNRSKRSWCIFC